MAVIKKLPAGNHECREIHRANFSTSLKSRKNTKFFDNIMQLNPYFCKFP